MVRFRLFDEALVQVVYREQSWGGGGGGGVKRRTYV